MNTTKITKPVCMPRHLTLISARVYEGFHLWPVGGPHVVQYLDRLINVVDAALAQSSKIFAVRVDLHLPMIFDGQPEYGNQVIESFIKSIRAKVDAERKRRLCNNGNVPQPHFRYVWAREQVSADQPHFHFLLIFNGNFFQQLGRIDLDYGLTGIIFSAWASVFGLSLEKMSQLVHFPSEPTYFVTRDNVESQRSLLERTSYLCKSATKVWSDGAHAFGNSR